MPVLPLVGSMITVSATAVGPFFPPGTIAMPTFESTMPTGIAWIVSCVVIGAAMTLVALIIIGREIAMLGGEVSKFVSPSVNQRLRSRTREAPESE